MKKSFRLLSLLVVFAICCTLSGCGMLDDLRKTRATMTADGTIKFYDGTEYLPLPECESLQPIFNEYKMVYLVEEDLPLLLTIFSENVYTMSDNGVFLEFYTEDSSIYYCRSDYYDKVLDSINNGITDGVYVYWYYDYEEEIFGTYTLTDAQADTIDEICATQTPEVLPEAAMVDYDYLVDLMICPEDKLFMTDTLDLCLLNDKYFIVVFDEESTALYSVPESLFDTFDEIFEAHIESESHWMEEDW